VRLVKDTPPSSWKTCKRSGLSPPIAGEQRLVAATLDLGHGRIEPWRLQTRTVLVGYRDGPGLAHVSQGERQILITKTREGRDEVVAGVTSLAPEHADAGRLLALVRRHWPSANQTHWVREVTCDEDRSPVQCGSMPQVMAAVRHTVIGLMRWADQTHMAVAVSPLCGPARVSLEAYRYDTGKLHGLSLVAAADQ